MSRNKKLRRQVAAEMFNLPFLLPKENEEPDMTEDLLIPDPEKCKDPSLLWLTGVHCLRNGDIQAAKRLWARSLEFGKQADTMLAMYSLDQNSEWLENILDVPDSFLDFQTSNECFLYEAVYYPGGFIAANFHHLSDIKRALFLLQERKQSTGQHHSDLLVDCQEEPLTMLIRARLDFEKQKYEQCLRQCQSLRASASLKHFQADIDLMLGASLTMIGLHTAAIEFLQNSLREFQDKEAQMHAHYYLAAAYEQCEDKQQMKHHLQMIYAIDINFADVEQRIRPEKVKADSDRQAWENIVASLENGMLTDESQSD